MQPSNVESKTTVDTRPLVGRNQSIPTKQKSANNNVHKSNDLTSGYGREANRRGYGNRFDHYDEVKATGNKLTRHPATATGGKRINIQQRQKQAQYAPNLVPEADVSNSQNFENMPFKGGSVTNAA